MRFSLLVFLSFAMLCIKGQPNAYHKLSLEQLLDSAAARHQASDYIPVNNILKEVRSRLDSSSKPKNWSRYHKLAGANLLEMRNLPAAQEEFHTALKISEELKDSLNIALIHSELANTFTLQGTYREALEYYNKALSYFPEKDEQYNSTKTNMYLAYKGLNQYDKALSVLASSRSYYQSIGDYKSLATLENNIGEIYRDNIGDLDQAKAHYHRSIKANKKASSDAGLAKNYHNLAAMFLELHETDSALYYAQLSMQIKEELGDEGGIASANFILGDVYFQQGNNAKAINHFEKSLTLSKKYQLMEGVYYNSLRLGKLYRQQGNLNQSESFLITAKEVAEGSEDLQIIGESYNQLYQLYKEKEDYKAALAYHEKSQEIGDSLSNLKAAQNLDELRTQYESDLAGAENLVLREKEKAQEAHISSQRKLLYISVASIILLLLAATWLISIVRQRNHALLREKESKTTLEVQNQKLKESEDRLQRTNDLKNKILSVLGHDLRNPINNISTLLGTISSIKLDQNEFGKVMGYLKKETDISQIILQEILAWARLQMDEEGKILETINAGKLISEIAEIHNHSAREKAITFNTSLTEIEFSADRNQMKSVFSNLLFNAIKFSKKGSQIDVGIEENDQKVVFQIIDSGKGIDPQVLENLNKRQEVISKNGTGGERGTGIGLRIVNDFIKDHNGSLIFSNNENGGATATVVIPIRQKGVPNQKSDHQQL